MKIQKNHKGNPFAWSSSSNPFSEKDDLAENVTKIEVALTSVNMMIDLGEISVNDDGDNYYDIVKIWGFNDTMKILSGGSKLFKPQRRNGMVAAIWIAVFREYHGDEHSLLQQMQEFFHLAKQNDLTYFDVPLSRTIVSSPQDVVEISKTIQIFPLVASRFAVSGSEKDLVGRNDYGGLDEFKRVVLKMIFYDFFVLRTVLQKF